MKKLIFLSFLFISVIAQARQISVDEAASIASEFFGSISVTHELTRKNAQRVHGMENGNTGNAPYYVFNADNGQGFVIISGDTRSKRILGYSDKGTFDTNNLPPQLCSLLDKYANRITSLPPSVDQDPSWETPIHKVSSNVGKLLKTANWDQGYPYNNLCPELDGQKCATGCVATAMAIIMKYYNWPPKGTGNVSYEWNGQQLNSSFDSSVYDWTKFLDEYTDESYTDDTISEIAQLLHDVAFSIKASFGSSTYASDVNACIALVDNFGFRPGLGSANLAYCNEQYFFSIIKSEIDNSRPLLFSSLKTPSGTDPHTYVCDGYDNDGLVHFNWGWGGYANGYYSIDPLKGIFGTDIYCNYGISPSSLPAPEPIEGPMVGSLKDFSYWADNLIHCTYSTRYYYSENLPKVTFGYIVKNNSNNEAVYCEQGILSMTPDNRGGSWSQDSKMDFTIDLPDGEYTIYPAYQESGKNWQKCLSSDLYQNSIGLSIINGVNKFTNNSPQIDFLSRGVEVDGICYILDEDKKTAEVTYKNELYNSYHDDITIPSHIYVDNKEYTVNSIGDYAFRDCHSLGNVILPNTIENLGAGCFMNVLFKSINLGDLDRLTSINNGAFYFNFISAGSSKTYSKPISLPKNLQHIGKSAFMYVNFGLLEIPESVTSIDDEALARNNIDAIKFTRVDLSNINFSKTAFNDGYLYNPDTFPILLFPENVMEEYLALDAFKNHDIVKGYNKEIIQAENLDIYCNGKIVPENGILYVNPGESMNFRAKVYPESATIGEIAWYLKEDNDHPLSDKTTIHIPYDNDEYKYTVWHYNDGGNPNAQYLGHSQYVTCLTRDGSEVSRNFTINVYARIQDIILNENEISIKVGETKKLDINVLPSKANTELIEWSSSNPDVASVDQEGSVTAHAPGNANIHVEALDGSGVSNDCSVKVNIKTGIENLITDKPYYVKIFNLQGMLVFKGIYSEANLTPDFYIIEHEGKSKKVKVE